MGLKEDFSGAVAAFEKLEQFVEDKVHDGVEFVEEEVNKYAPILVDVFEQFVEAFGGIAVDSVRAWAMKELSGSEKLSGVVTDIIQAAEAVPGSGGVKPDTRPMAQTLAQNAYLLVSAKVQQITAKE